MSVELLDSLFSSTEECLRFVTRLKELAKAPESAECIGRLVKETPDRWLFTLSTMDDRFVGDYVSPFPATEENVATFNRGVAEVAQRLRIYLETNDASRVPAQPSPFAELTHPDALAPNWVVVNEFGESRAYVDRAGIVVRDTGVLAWVRYELNPPGLDKLSNKPVAELWNCEEFDLAADRVRRHRMVMKYTDGSQGEPVRPVSDWHPVTDGSLKTLEYLRMLVRQ
jgi:hypothetical protein